LSFFGWLIALVTGKLPDAAHQAVAAVVRYAVRYSGFVFMVTSQYPKGMFGDHGAPPAAFAAVAPAEPIAPAVGEPGPQATAYPWRLTLPGPAKATVTAVLVVGLLAFAAIGIAVSLTAKTEVSNAIGLSQVEQANSALGKTLAAFPAQASACNGQITCVTALDRNAGKALHAFASSIRSAGISGAASPAAGVLAGDAEKAGQDLDQLGAATSVAQYRSVAANGTLQQDLSVLGPAYNALIKELGAS
jgi:hypothetical protein